MNAAITGRWNLTYDTYADLRRYGRCKSCDLSGARDLTPNSSGGEALVAPAEERERERETGQL